MSDTWLIAIDLDYTALQDLYNLNEYTGKILRELSRLGNKVMIATARPGCLTLPHYRKLELDTLVALCNGAHFMNLSDTSFEVERRYVASSDLEKVINILPQNFISDFGMENNDKLYLLGNMKGSPYFKELINQSDVTSIDFSTVPLVDAGRIFIRLENAPEIDRIIEELKRIQTLEVYYRKQNDTGSAFISIKSVSADKWYCVKKAADYYGIPGEKIITFGDEYNDRLMLKEAGIGFVMLNGTEELKQEIGNITRYNNVEGGVGRELAEMFDLHYI
jgi:Cof subfamily protein (haloacid dehalogenase superfamily)